MTSVPPRLEEAEAISAGLTLYGVAANAGQSLGSERDQVWLLLQNGNRVAVLKVANCAESTDTLDMEAEAAKLAAELDPSLPVAQPRASKSDGNYRAAWTARDGRTHWVRCYSLLPGTHHHSDSGPLPDQTLLEWGSASARLARALRSFQHPAATRHLPWDVQHAGLLRPLLNHVQDPTAQELCKQALQIFDVRVRPTLPHLRHQIVHGDLNLGNVLLQDGAVSGIIDFGDMTYTALVCDIGSCSKSHTYLPLEL